MTTTKKTGKTAKTSQAKAPKTSPAKPKMPAGPLKTGEGIAFIGYHREPPAKAGPGKGMMGFLTETTAKPAAPADAKPKAPVVQAPAKAPSKFSLLREALLTGKPHTVEDLMKVSGFDKRNLSTALYIVAKRPPKGKDPIKTKTDDQGRIVLAK